MKRSILFYLFVYGSVGTCLLDHQVAADEVQPATAVANVNEPAQKPVETDLAQAGGVSADEASVNAAIAANAQDVSGASDASLPEATILHTNDVHGRIVEEKRCYR